MKKRLLLLIALSMAIMVVQADAKSKKKSRSYSIRLETGFSTTYDDNVYRRTDDERDEFPTSIMEGKWDRIHTLDDFIVGQWIDVEYRRSETRVTARAKQTNYWQNPAKTFHYYGLNVRQKLAPWTYAYLDYRYIPRYYIRQIYDDDTRDHEAYDYAKHRLAFDLRRSFLKRGALSIRIHGRYEHEDYTDNFDEYDFNAYATEGEIGYDITRDLEIGFEALYREVHTKGYDEPDETADDNDDSDGSYEENTFELKLSYDLPFKMFGRTPSLRLSGSKNKKVYTADESPWEDPYHAGREDSKYAIGAGMRLGLGHGVSTSLSYKWQQREVDSFAKDDLGDEKDFTSNTIGMQVSVTQDILK